MDEKTKLYVFAKKEVALIFVFMILIAITSFVFGVKVGKTYSYQLSGLAPEDKKKVDLMSENEEQVNKLLEEKKVEGATTEHGSSKDALAETHERLEQELKKLDTEKQSTPVAAAKEVKAEESPFHSKPAEVKTEAPAVKEAAPKASTKKDQYSGKFTIQLGSHKTMAEAEKFADGFRIRGYDPIINEIEVKSQVWYRVSLGVFTTVSEAKEYIIKEKSLFQGQDYVISRFD